MLCVRLIWAILAFPCSFSLGQSTSQSATQSSPSYGTVFAEDFNKNLAAVEKNLYTGVVGVTDPVFKFAIDTAPNLAHLYATFNGVNVPAGLASLGKDLYGKVAVGGGKALGGAAVLGSSVLGKGLGTLGDVLEAKNGELEKGVKAGISFAGELADKATDAAVKGAGAAGNALTAVGDGLIAAGSSANVISENISQLVKAITARLVLAIQSAHKLATDLFDARDNLLKNGSLALDSKTQENIYNAFNSYVKIVSNIQEIFGNFMKSIMGAAANSLANSGQGSTGSSSSSSATS
ncbi:hypothetical protein J6590_097666 [Homalodisca vitripennis]|nr:hypothetical protein J6590_097666 [Homalodisca vitripennis]